jgi:hypothetical protein
MPEALRAAEMLSERWDVAADVWSVTSWNELNRDGLAIEKEILRHPERPARTPFVTEVLSRTAGPAVAVSDWMRAVPEQIRPWVPNSYVTLGTDGFGFSDTRPAARRRQHERLQASAKAPHQLWRVDPWWAHSDQHGPAATTTQPPDTNVDRRGRHAANGDDAALAHATGLAAALSSRVQQLAASDRSCASLAQGRSLALVTPDVAPEGGALALRNRAARAASAAAGLAGGFAGVALAALAAPLGAPVAPAGVCPPVQRGVKCTSAADGAFIATRLRHAKGAPRLALARRALARPRELAAPHLRHVPRHQLTR